ncbi:hypothetical protein C0Q70_12587 [Pomacea canaliculata]|uniref:Uncharacterized protein n=1 Tax=Pomacea canaliculata TaxID=400727 RepID=A0A2T7P1Y2_POMCA|nr:hypothetical protein C0Q70_12587 [Pomacea canaliculata]
MYRVVSVLDFLPLPEARETELKCIVHHLTLAEKIIAIKKVYITDPPFEPVILGPNEIRQGENATTSFLGEDGRLWHNVTSKLTYSPSWQERDMKLRCTATFSIITISVSGMINISVKDDSSSLSEKLGSADVTGSTHTQTETSSGENTSAPRPHPDTSSGSGTKTLVNSVPNGEQEPKANMNASPEEQSLVYSMSKTRRYLLESTSNTGDNDMEASGNNSTRSTSNTDDNKNLVDKHSMQVSENNSARSASNTSDNGNLVDKHRIEVSGHNSVSSRSSQEGNHLDHSSGRSDASVVPPTKADDLNSSRDNTSEKKILELSNLRVLLKTLHTRGKTLPTWKRHEFLSDNTTSVGNFVKKIEMDTDSNISSEAELRGSPKPFDDDKTTLGVKKDEKEKIRHPRFENTKHRPNNLQAEDGVISDVISRNDAQNLTSQPATAGHNSSQPVTGPNRSQPVKTGGKDKELGSGVFDGKASLVTPRLSVSEASFPPLNSMIPNTGEKDWKAHVDQPVPQLYDDYDRFENFEKPDKKNVEKEPAQDLPANAGTDKMMFAAGFVSVFILLVLVALGLLWYKRLRRHPDPTDGY